MFGNEKMKQNVESNNTTAVTTEAASEGGTAPSSSTTVQEKHATSSASTFGVLNNRSTDNVKRKKSKSRNATVPLANSNYPKEHLDAWLETCLKDAATPLLSSSSEFLDYNPNSFNSNRKLKNEQSQHHSPLPHAHQYHQSPPPQQQQKQQPHQFFVNRPKSYQKPFSQGFQKTVPNFMKSSYNSKFLDNSHNLMHNDGSEFASLPPIVNLIASENEINSTDVLDGSNNPNNSRGFRFSDPCLINPSDNDSKINEQNTPNRRNINNPTDMDENNKFFVALMEQINLLHETNSKICRNLHETKVDIEALKHAPNWGVRHRRDSLSGLSTHSQPMGYVLGTHSPAPTYHSGMYTPGMMTDVVREVKEAARVREDALINRVKSMVEERSWSVGEGNLRMMREIEELKSHVQHLRADRKESNKRIAQLEAENKYIRQIIGNEIYRSTPIRKNLIPNEMPTQMRQNQNNFNLNYATTNQADNLNALHITERVDKIQNSTTNDSFTNGSLTQQHNGGAFSPILDNERSMDDTLDLRRELQDALTTRKQAESRIIALENMVRKLQVSGRSDIDERNGSVKSSQIGGDFKSHQTNVTQIQQQQQQHTQGHSTKFSLAGPITDL